jgi:hypothetical protein
MKVVTLLIVSLAIVPCGKARANWWTAEEMLSNCTPVEQAQLIDGKSAYTPTYEAGLCVGFLGGLLNTSGLVSDPHNPRSSVTGICPQSDVSPKQLAAIFNTYVRAHPESYQWTALSLAVPSLSAAFPCRPKVQ